MYTSSFQVTEVNRRTDARFFFTLYWMMSLVTMSSVMMAANFLLENSLLQVLSSSVVNFLLERPDVVVAAAFIPASPEA